METDLQCVRFVFESRQIQTWPESHIVLTNLACHNHIPQDGSRDTYIHT